MRYNCKRILTTFLIHIGLGAAYISQECPDYQCAFKREYRSDCSPKENSRERCLSLGCCFDNSVFDTIWCFHPLGLPQGRCPHPECQVLPEDRQLCFKVDVSKEVCSSYGCCYDNDSNGAPVCFKRKVDVIAFTGFTTGFTERNKRYCMSVDPFQREQCGGLRTTQSQCTRFRCCWLDVRIVGPRCFHPRPFRGMRLLS